MRLRRKPQEPNARRTVAPGLAGLAWSCMVCGEERPDECIDVFSRERVFELGVRMRANVRHCNDRPDCVTGAPDVSLMAKMMGDDDG